MTSSFHPKTRSYPVKRVTNLVGQTNFELQAYLQKCALAPVAPHGMRQIVALQKIRKFSNLPQCNPLQYAKAATARRVN